MPRDRERVLPLFVRREGIMKNIYMVIRGVIKIGMAIVILILSANIVSAACWKVDGPYGPVSTWPKDECKGTTNTIQVNSNYLT